MTFDTFPLHQKILKAVATSGYTEPTKIQLKAIPKILRGFDVRASAQTGTGKTAAFLLPALNRLVTPSSKQGKGPRIVILVPVRELAMQITEQAEKYRKYLNKLNIVCVVGGVPYPVQMRKLARPCDILIATPGRLIDLIDRGKVNFSRVEMLVLDEADRMLDMGFVEPVEDIVKAMPTERQTLLFSATLQGSVLKLSEKLMDKPMEIVVHAEKEKHESISQRLHFVDNLSHKNRLLDHILSEDEVNYAIVFTSTKRHADQLVLDLEDKGHRAKALHGNMNQRQRTRTIMQLKNGKIKILVATDVAARGIDVQSITHVINFDLPRSAEDYVHRIGRTGRAGAKGTALSFAAGQDVSLVKKIERFTGQQIDVKEIEGLEPRKQQRPSNASNRPHSKPNPNRRFRSRSGPPRGKTGPPRGKSGFRPRKARAGSRG